MLTQVAGTPVCPSDDVDEAWHLHITRTADYERFCRDALGGFLHHHPADAGPDEHARHRAMYERTLSLYRRAFQAPAPIDVWPATDARFAPPPPASAAIALPGPFAHPAFLAVAIAGAVVLLALGLDLAGALDASHAISGPYFLLGAVPLTFALVVLAFLASAPFERAGPRDLLDPYEAAWLAGGTPRLATTAIALLVDRGAMLLRHGVSRAGWHNRATTRLVVAPTRPDGLHPVEIACLAGARDGTLTFDRAHDALGATGLRIRDRLRPAGLASDAARITPARAGAALLLSAWLVVALERILHAMSTPRPVVFLVLLTLASAATLLRLVVRGRATWRGNGALDAQRRTLQRRNLTRGKPIASPIPGGLLPMTLALLGPGAVLAQPLLAGLDDAIGPRGMRATSTGDAWSSSGGGDGGSGGGSGCGGGGCGGGCGG